MAVNEKRRQVRARLEHQCDICGKPIKKGAQYINCKREVCMGNGWAEEKRHIHCDALLRFYADKMCFDPANITKGEMRQFVNFLCDTECMRDFRNRCGHDGFSCEPVLYALRYRPGYSAVMESANIHETEG